MNQPKRIFIVGHTGARKSSLSEALAEKLGWQYIDWILYYLYQVEAKLYVS